MINKKTALFFVVVNALYVAIEISLFFLLRKTIFDDFHYHKSLIGKNAALVFSIVDGILLNIIFWGWFWMFRAAGEKKFIRIGAILGAGIQLIALVGSTRNFISNSTYQLPPEFAVNFILSLIILIRLYSVVTIFFIRNKVIKKFLLAFYGLVALTFIIPVIERPLYDNFGYSWLLINREFLILLPDIVLLILFVEVYNMAGRHTQKLLPPAEESPIAIEPDETKPDLTESL